MEILENFVRHCLADCIRTNYNREIWINQAFGAVQFYIIQNPDEYEDVDKMWSKYKPQFEYHIWGISFEL